MMSYSTVAKLGMGGEREDRADGKEEVYNVIEVAQFRV